MRVAVCVVLPLLLSAADGPVALPAPQTDGGMPLMQALRERSSRREFRPEALGMQTLSNLLWAAFGVNRPDGKRTAPSPYDARETDIFVVLEKGTYRYDAKEHRLESVAAGRDLRGLTGDEDFVLAAPLHLVYVSDLDKLNGTEVEKRVWSGADSGFIGQNVYLFCASEGLATVIRALADDKPLRQALRLRPGQQITLAQTVGYPK